jgi:hypothetical protein
MSDDGCADDEIRPTADVPSSVTAGRQLDIRQQTLIQNDLIEQLTVSAL